MNRSTLIEYWPLTTAICRATGLDSYALLFLLDRQAELLPNSTAYKAVSKTFDTLTRKQLQHALLLAELDGERHYDSVYYTSYAMIMSVTKPEHIKQYGKIYG